MTEKLISSPFDPKHSLTYSYSWNLESFHWPFSLSLPPLLTWHCASDIPLHTMPLNPVKGTHICFFFSKCKSLTWMLLYGCWVTDCSRCQPPKSADPIHYVPAVIPWLGHGLQNRGKFFVGTTQNSKTVYFVSQQPENQKNKIEIECMA